ncbi:MBL fold metallo-hydrolase [Paucibacter soli]|uniref:MBL fold metallo-hydrolase n=1 Tax=Paucibacter soli TaxID=3133433 RepID=UPI00309B5F85
MDLSLRADSGGRGVIDALILSHFDRDHIIGAALLVDKYMVRRVYVPYLAPTELAFVLAGQEVQLEESYIRELHGLATGTGTLFGVPVTMVQPGGDGNNDGPPQNPDGPRPDRDEAADVKRELTSLQALDRQTGRPAGAVLSARSDVGLGAPGLPGTAPWVLRFWNRGLDNDLTAHLFDELVMCEFPMAALSEPSAVDELVDWLEVSTNRRAALQAYRSAIAAYKPAWAAEASGQRLANLLSLCMYSGPTAAQFGVRGYEFLDSSGQDRGYERRYWRSEDRLWHLLVGGERVGWLGTGDAPLGEPPIWADFSAHYADVLDRVLTVQVPHHGAAPTGGPKFFNPALIGAPGMSAVVSVGTTNSYGHPRAGVLKEVLAEGARLHVVTEECWLGFHEVIDLQLS